jgi:hypothetical protein
MMGFGYLVGSPALNLILGKRGIRVKNVVLGLANTAILAVASCGLFFNNCEGWRTVWPSSHAGVVINSDVFNRNNKIFFPLLVSLCVGLQVLYWGLVWQQWSPKNSTSTQHAIASTELRDVEASITSEEPADEHESHSMVQSEGDLGVSQRVSSICQSRWA